MLEPDEKVIREFNDRGLIWFLESNANLKDLMKILAKDIAEELDFSKAVRLNRSFIPQDLYKQEADMLYSIPFLSEQGEVLIYLLLEHQTAPDAIMGFRFLSYLVDIWKEQVRIWHDKPKPRPPISLTPIVPILLYTGEDAWTHSIDLSSLMSLPRQLESFIPKYELLRLNLRDLQTEDLLESKTAIASILHALKFANAPIRELTIAIRQAVASLEKLPPQQQEWRRAMHYILLLIRHKRRPAERSSLFEQVTDAVTERHRNEVTEMFQTDAQFLEEKGRVEGQTETTRKLFLSLLRHKFSPLPLNTEEKIQQLTKDKLEELFDEAIDSKSLNEIGF